MARKSGRAPRQRAASASGKTKAVESEQVSMAESIRNWIEGFWQDLRTFASQIWETIRGLCAFTRDLGRLTWFWLFRPQEFVAERTRFQLKYLAVQIDPRELASALAVSLNAR